MGGALHAYVDGAVVGPPATISGHSWSLDLPPGTIVAAGTTIDLELSAPGATAAEVTQLIALDDGMPVISSDSRMTDERGDTISFASGEPVHTHRGAIVDLGTGCPDIYKYAYLTDTTPAYATEATSNPIAWHLSGASPVGIDPTAGAYRVRTSDVNVVLDWAPVVPDQQDIYTIALHRNGARAITELGTRDGKLYVDVTLRDRLGAATTATYCIAYHPMAAPLEIQPIAQESAGQPVSLWSLTLSAAAHVSAVLNASLYPRVIGQRFVQHSAEPIALDLVLAPPTGTYAKTVASVFVAQTVGTVGCGNEVSGWSTDARCQTATYTNTSTPSSGTLSSGSWSIHVLDEATNAEVCTSYQLHSACTIPARATGAAAHAYRVIAYLDNVANLWPTARGPYDEYTAANRTYTGLAPSTLSKCNTKHLQMVNGINYYTCDYSTYTNVVALASAKLNFDPFHIAFQTSIGGGPLAPVAYALPTAPAMTWDAGTSILPGN
jgi:hypothetical protein